jgi:glycerol-3-phosphate acyltransferase PlsY
MVTLTSIVVIAACYLVGAIPFGLLIGKIIGGVDIRQLGSGNIGATNVGRVLGRKWGALAFALDVAKGLAPVAIVGRCAGETSWLAGHPSTLTILAGAAAICGHIFPIYLKFQGGKGVATSCGVVVYLSPVGTAIALGTWLIMVAIWRYVSLGSITAAIVFMAYILITEARAGWPSPALVVFGFIMAALVILRHRSNIQRLLAGTENKIGVKRDA